MLLLTLGILAGLLQLAGYALYARETVLGHIKPNTASWGLWALGAVLESGSYAIATQDIAKNILPVLCALSAIAFFFIALRRGHFEKIDCFDWIIIGLDIVAVAIWVSTRSAIYANIYIVTTAVFSFVPIFRHAWRDPKHENATPWIIWTLAYSLLTAVVLIDFISWTELVFPATYVLLCTIIGCLAWDRRIPGKMRLRK
jgi:hypothetical protein